MSEKRLDRLRLRGEGLIAEITDAFRHVSRLDGVSWSESVVIDRYGRMDERLAARATDTDRRWLDLVDDPSWNPDIGIGGFSFLDPIGFRYYLAPALIRTIRTGVDQGIVFHLTVPQAGHNLREHSLEKISLLDAAQCRCVARAIRFMIELYEARIEDAGPERAGSLAIEADGWHEAMNSHWSEFC